MKIVFYWKLEASFNTSHVTLYLLVSSFWVSFPWFQYISCYSLSKAHYRTEMLKRGFNTSHVTLYLPASHPLKLFLRRFNTSHVTLYQSKHSQRLKVHSRFNTSHVTLYQGHIWGISWKILVSIHLMLLFIPALFKTFLKLLVVSIHLMLLFICKK